MAISTTGSLALYVAPLPQPLSVQAVRGVGVSKGGARGAWLKATGHARLRASPAGLSLHLADHLLLQQPLCSSAVALTLLRPCEATSVLVLAPTQQDSAAPVAFCLAMDQQDCSSFVSGLQALVAAATQASAAAEGAQATAHQGGGAAAGAADAAAQLAAADDAKAAVRRLLLDPGFQSYVDQVEAVWDEVERELDELEAVDPGVCHAAAGARGAAGV